MHTVQDLANAICEEMGIPVQRIRILHRGMQLEQGDYPLHTCIDKLLDGSMLHVIHRLRCGGGDPG